MADIVEWLGGLGLGEYAERFAENAVDIRALPHLTEQDLKDLGLLLGHRRILLSAIAELDSSAGTAPAKTVAVPPEAAAERRQLTVMFCDLVGSTALAERLDPEDMREVLRAYQGACVGVIGEVDGHVAKYVGDGLLVYFGYPQAHEDDAERAVHAGLGIIDGLGPLNRQLGERHGVTLRIRVGIHTGLVVAGEMGSGDSREADAIVGETPNVAARLEGLAAPDTVVISAATQRLVEGLFALEDLGPQRLKGVTQLQTVFRVSGRSGARSRFEVSAAKGLVALVGRKAEIGLLAKRWAQAEDGEGQVVLLLGEAGVGKSRIIRAFRDRLAGVAHDRVLYYCSTYHRNSALFPVIDQIERTFGFEASDDVDRKLDKLEAKLAAIGLARDENAPLLAALLSLPADRRYPPIQVSPQLRRRKTLEAVLAGIQAMAARSPVLMVVEDAHVSDPSTLEMLGLVIERLGTARVLLLVGARPEFDPPWGGHAHLTTIRLNRLSRTEAAALVAESAGGRHLPDAVRDQIVAKTDGVPLFVEELTKTVLESGLLTAEGNGYVLRGPLPALAIPTSLQDSLMARLDRLARAKEVAQLAAVLGRTFSYELLAAVSPIAEQPLADALARLEDAELVYRRGLAPDLIYEFKHALVQDAAYQSLLKSNRQRHHGKIARVLEERFPSIAESEPELVAHHYTEAGLAEQAIDGWLKAARRAMQRSANVEAEDQLGRGLALLDQVADTAARHQREVALQNALGVCLMPIRGFGSPDVAEAFAKAAAASERSGDQRGLFVALRGRGQYHMISGDLGTAREHAGRILDLAERQQDPGLHIEAHHLGWSTLCFTADFEAARRHAEAGIASYDRDRDHGLTYVYSGHDPGVCCRSFGALAICQLGYPDQALALCREGEALARDLAHPFSVTVALWALGMLHLLRRDWDGIRETGVAMIDHCTEKGFPPFVPMGKIFRGGARAVAGDAAAGLAELGDGIAGLRASGTEYTLPSFFAWLAELSGKDGALDAGFAVLEDGIALARKNDDRFSLPEFHRIEGELLLARSAEDKAAAEACYRQAIATARAQRAKLLELRAAAALARLLADDRRRPEARDTLAPIHAWFTEGAELRDLEDARALLAALS